jgi:hypothetical protein
MSDDANQSDAATNKGPFWLGWQLSKQAREKWGQFAGDNFNGAVKPEDLHFTMFYCNDGANPEQEWPQPMNAAWAGKPSGVGILGKALVVLFDAPQFIHSRFAQLQGDYKHSFPTLIPHMTLTYDGDKYRENLHRTWQDIQGSDMPLTFTHEDVQVPEDPTQNKDESAFLDFMSALQPAGYVHKPWNELRFIQAFTKCFSNNIELAAAYESGNAEIYKKHLVKLVADLENERTKL